MRHVRGDRRRRRRPRARVRRRAVGRARRRPGAQPVHGEDVRAGALRARSAQIKRTFDPDGIFNPGKIVDAPPLDDEPALRPGAIARAQPDDVLRLRASTAACAGAVEMCSGLGACRKTLDGHDVPVVHGDARGSALDARPRQRAAARDGRPARRGRARRRRRARGARSVPRVPRVQEPSARSASTSRDSRASSWRTTGSGTARRCARASLGHVDRLARWGSRFAPLSNAIARSAPARWLNERVLGLDRRRTPPAWASDVRDEFRRRPLSRGPPGLRSRRAGARARALHLQRHVHELLSIPRSAWRRSTCCKRAGYRRRRSRPTSAAAGRSSRRGCSTRRASRARENAGRLLSARRGRPAARVPRAELPVRDSRGRARSLLRGDDAAQGARRRGAVACCSRSGSKHECAAGRARLALRPGSVADRCSTATAIRRRWATARAGEGAARPHPRRDRRRSRCRLLRHGGIVRLRARSLRGVAGDRRAAAAARRAHARARSTCSSRAATSCRQQIADFTGVRGAARGRTRADSPGASHEPRRSSRSLRSRSRCSSAASAG